MKKILSVILICSALCACQHTQFAFSTHAPAQPSATRTLHYVFWGKKATIDPVRVCGSADNVALVEEKETTGQSWLRWLTACIYQPVTVNVYCKQPVRSSYQIQQPR